MLLHRQAPQLLSVPSPPRGHNIKSPSFGCKSRPTSDQTCDVTKFIFSLSVPVPLSSALPLFPCLSPPSQIPPFPIPAFRPDRETHPTTKRPCLALVCLTCLPRMLFLLSLCKKLACLRRPRLLPLHVVFLRYRISAQGAP